MITLPKNKITVLKAQDPKYKRGLLVKYNKDGSYDMQYWFDKPSKVFPVEVAIDGKSVKKDARKVSMLYHPELGSTGNFGASNKRDNSKSDVLNLDTPTIRYILMGLTILKLLKGKKCK